MFCSRGHSECPSPTRRDSDEFYAGSNSFRDTLLERIYDIQDIQ